MTAAATFLINFFMSKNISVVTAFLCWSNVDYMQLTKEMSRRGMALAISEVSNPNLRGLTFDHYQKVGMVIDYNCGESYELMQMVSERFLFNSLHHWLLLGDSINGTCGAEISDNIADFRILVDSEVMWSCDNQLYDVYKISADSPPVISIVSKTETWLTKDPVARRRGDLQNITLKAIQVISDPKKFTTLDDLKMRHVDTFTKSNHQLVVILSQDLNFTLDTIKQLPSFGWNRNGTFDGLMGYFQRHEIDLGSCGVLMRDDRFQVVDYTSGMLRIYSSIIFRQPSLSTVSNIFQLPFSATVWACCVSLCVFVGLVFALQTKFSNAIEISMDNMLSGEMFSFLIGVICQQGYYRSPSTLSARIIVLISFVSSIAIFTSYSANIVALLQSPSSSIKSITDLALSPLTLGIQDEVYNHIYFQESTEPATKLLYNLKMAPRGPKAFIEAEEGIKRMQKGSFAFQVELNTGYQIISDTFTETEKCGLNELQAYRLPQTSLPLVKNSPYREIVKVRLLWQREVGFFDRMWRIWYPQKPVCNEGQRSFVSVGIPESLPAMKALIYGTAAAFAILILELIQNYRKKTSALA